MLQELLDFLKDQKTLPIKFAYMMVIDMITKLKELPTLVNVNLKEEQTITVCGDIHGQFYDLLNIFALNGLPSSNYSYLFNGDFVDRGSFSVEVIITLFFAKILFPDSIHLARGNHETQNMNRIYGFLGEVKSKYDEKLYSLFCEAFCGLPLVHVINDEVFVVHGGLFGNDNVTLKDIQNVNRFCEPPESGIMTDLLWSDPQPTNGRAPSKRGVAFLFGPDITDEFLKLNNLKLVIRSHEVKDDGHSIEHDGKLITVFSAPNYCDQMGNKGAYIKFSGTDSPLKPNIKTFNAVEHPPVKSMMFANPFLNF
eukprot:GHVO01004827.1.p1 GENE.GHVO01004827.1~~GHVO01004827.1.p1  ORF type:complete len:310 (-),score=47.07 GHVO01004827.1:725-1654(-)